MADLNILIRRENRPILAGHSGYPHLIVRLWLEMAGVAFHTNPHALKDIAYPGAIYIPVQENERPRIVRRL